MMTARATWCGSTAMADYGGIQDFYDAHGTAFPGSPADAGTNMREAFTSFVGQAASEMGLGAVIVPGSALATVETFFAAMDDAIAKARAKREAATATATTTAPEAGASAQSDTLTPTTTAAQGGNVTIPPAQHVTQKAGGEPGGPLNFYGYPTLSAGNDNAALAEGGNLNPPNWRAINQQPAEEKPKFPLGIVLTVLALLAEGK